MVLFNICSHFVHVFLSNCWFCGWFDDNIFLFSFCFLCTFDGMVLNLVWLKKFCVGLAMCGSQKDERHELVVEIMKNRLKFFPHWQKSLRKMIRSIAVGYLSNPLHLENTHKHKTKVKNKISAQKVQVLSIIN